MWMGLRWRGGHGTVDSPQDTPASPSLFTREVTLVQPAPPLHGAICRSMPRPQYLPHEVCPLPKILVEHFHIFEASPNSPITAAVTVTAIAIHAKFANAAESTGFRYISMTPAQFVYPVPICPLKGLPRVNTLVTFGLTHKRMRS